MDIKSLNKTEHEIINSSTSEDIAKRLVFLWDLREDDFEAYSINELATEKEYIYRAYPDAVTLAYQIK